MKKLIIVVLVTAALGFSAAPPAHAKVWSDFIIHLAKYGCQGRSAKFQNGCYAYIEPRVNRASSPSEALAWCKGNSRCGEWYDKGSSAQQLCFDGCTYLYKMGQ